MPHQPETSNITNTSAVNTVKVEQFMRWERHSSFDRVVRIVAWVLRFCHNTRARICGTILRDDKHLSLVELRKAETKLMELV